ncbi:MAG: hypothetical protein J2P17_15335, partial [Mycobacterium sp.]|nr:hypothetical protein [Mycobacterium sp.]
MFRVAGFGGGCVVVCAGYEPVAAAAGAAAGRYQELCRELSAAGPGTFGELDATGARSVLRRYSDAW